MSGVDRFPDDGVVFLRVLAPPELESLRLDVLRELGTRFKVKPRDVEGDAYRFHATLAYNLPPGTADSAWSAVADAEAQFTFEADAFGLFYYTGTEWILYRRARLGHR
jgi:2'-5' RNA ligase